MITKIPFNLLSKLLYFEETFTIIKIDMLVQISVSIVRKNEKREVDFEIQVITEISVLTE